MNRYRSLTDADLATKHDPKPYEHLDKRLSQAEVDRANAANWCWDGLIFDPRVETIPSKDPVPWLVYSLDEPLKQATGEGETAFWRPLPEYARPPVNPFLTVIREYRAERVLMNNPKGWDHIQRKFEQYLLSLNSYEHAEIDHARAVLARLAAFA